MKAAGLRWGGSDFAGECADMMHFDDGNRHADYVAYGAQHPTTKRKAEGQWPRAAGTGRTSPSMRRLAR
jgi:hypothetical protein